MFTQIINPSNNKSYSIFSKQGKQLLKQYVKQVNNNSLKGGAVGIDLAALDACYATCGNPPQGPGIAWVPYMQCRQACRDEHIPQQQQDGL